MNKIDNTVIIVLKDGSFYVSNNYIVPCIEECHINN